MSNFTHISSSRRPFASLSVGTWLVLSLLSLFMFILAQSLPLVKTSIWGFWGEQRHFLSLIQQSYQQGHQWMAILSLSIGFIIPLSLLLLQAYLLLGLYFKQLLPGFDVILKLIRGLSPWGMVPVFFLGLLVALVKVADMRTVDLQWGMLAYSCLALLLMAMQGLSATRIGQLAVAQGLVDSLNDVTHSCSALLPYGRALRAYLAYLIPIFLAIALVCLLLANAHPMMQISTLLSSQNYTLWQGVVNLWRAQMPFLAVLIFTVSLLLPLLKIVVLSVLYWLVQSGNIRGRRQVVWYKVLKLSAQWSMLDVIVVLLLGVLLNFGFLLSVKPLEGTLYYTLMVVFTVLASVCFSVDPHAGERGRA